jgi:hypothetical protein
MRCCVVLLLFGLAPACSPSNAPLPAVQTSATPAASAGSAQAAAAAATASAPPAPAANTASADSGVACGALGCLQFRSPEAAFEYVLASNPQVLAVGEAHAQRGTEGIASTTSRFAGQFLPQLVGRARALVVELLLANGKCGQAEQRVAEQQRPVTKPQAETNQNEFLELAERAKSLHIVPYPLRPTCEEYKAVVGAGAGDIDRMLVTVRDASLRTLGALLDAAPKAGEPNLLVAYGGALHNDLAPRPGREAWSFGPALRERTQGKYVELDLIVPEYVKDTESWQAFPWYASYRAAQHAQETLLYSPSSASFVLIFPRTNP